MTDWWKSRIQPTWTVCLRCLGVGVLPIAPSHSRHVYVDTVWHTRRSHAIMGFQRPWQARWLRSRQSKFYKYLIIYFPHLSSLASDDKTERSKGVIELSNLVTVASGTRYGFHQARRGTKRADYWILSSDVSSNFKLVNFLTAWTECLGRSVTMSFFLSNPSQRNKCHLGG